MRSKIALITGSTDGVGALVARKLASGGVHVLLHGRNQERGMHLVDDIGKKGGSASFFRTDLASMENVRDLAKDVLRDHDRLDILINNAGIGFGLNGSTKEISRDGFELRLAVNYLAGFLLTRLLLPLLKKSAPARIVNVASAGQESIDFNDVMLDKEYDGQRAYRQSKLAQVLFTFDLAEELAGTSVTVNCLHPATFMDTTMVRQAGITPMSSVEEGAKAILNLASSSELEGKTGIYFNQMRPAKANPQAYDPMARQRLRLLSYKLTDLPIRTRGSYPAAPG